MKEYKLAIITTILIIIWILCYYFVPSCDPPEDINEQLTLWKFLKLTSIPFTVIICLVLFQKFILPFLTNL